MVNQTLSLLNIIPRCWGQGAGIGDPYAQNAHSLDTITGSRFQKQKCHGKRKTEERKQEEE